jgi:hypothetical protein
VAGVWFGGILLDILCWYDRVKGYLLREHACFMKNIISTDDESAFPANPWQHPEPQSPITVPMIRGDELMVG